MVYVIEMHLVSLDAGAHSFGGCLWVKLCEHEDMRAFWQDIVSSTENHKACALSVNRYEVD